MIRLHRSLTLSALQVVRVSKAWLDPVFSAPLRSLFALTLYLSIPEI